MHQHGPDGIRLATWNVHKCIGTDRVFDPARTARVLAAMNADVLALQEADERFGARRGLLGRTWLEQHGLRMVGIPGAPAQSHGWRGNVLMVSRLMRIEAVSAIVLPGMEPRGALVADMTHVPSDTPIRVIACHLGLLRRCRKRQIQTLSSYFGRERAVFLMGDTNEWRSDADRLSSLSTLHRMGIGGERAPTFPSRYPLLGLDRIMSNFPCSIQSYPCDHAASDHLPLLVQASLGGVADTERVSQASA